MKNWSQIVTRSESASGQDFVLVSAPRLCSGRSRWSGQERRPDGSSIIRQEPAYNKGRKRTTACTSPLRSNVCARAAYGRWRSCELVRGRRPSRSGFGLSGSAWARQDCPPALRGLDPPGALPVLASTGATRIPYSRAATRTSSATYSPWNSCWRRYRSRPSRSSWGSGVGGASGSAGFETWTWRSPARGGPGASVWAKP
jgi:hypothetical protein